MDLILRHRVEEALRRGGGPSACRQALAEHLAAISALRSEGVARALAVHPRDLHLPGVDPRAVYSDRSVVTATEGEGRVTSACSAPSIVVGMVEWMAVQGCRRVLELGTGTGWTAALLAGGTGGRVTSVEPRTEVAAAARRALATSRARVRVVSAMSEAVADAPYDGLVVTYGPSDVDPQWLTLLDDGAPVIAPIGTVAYGLTRRGAVLAGTPLFVASFVHDAARAAGPERTTESEAAVAGAVRVLAPSGVAGIAPLVAAVFAPGAAAVADATTIDPGRLASFMLALSLAAGERFVMAAVPGGGWGFGLHDGDGGAVAICRAWRDFAFRHYRGVNEPVVVEHRGERGSELAMALTAGLACEWPRLEDVGVRVAPHASSPREGADEIATCGPSFNWLHRFPGCTLARVLPLWRKGRRSLPCG